MNNFKNPVLLSLNLLLTLIIISSLTSYSQNNQDIKDKARENKENRNRKSGNNSSDYGYYGDDDDGSDDCTSSIAQCCFDACASAAIDIVSDILSDVSSGIWEKEDEIPRIGSGDFIFMGGLSSPNNFVTVPRIRYNAAIYSTDLRVYSNFESHIEGYNNITTIDWQILMFNIVILEEANFRIGTGLLYETFTDLLFNEHTAMLDIYPSDPFKINLEYRFTSDYQTGEIVRSEVNFGLYYKIARWTNSDMYLFGNYMGADYHETGWFNTGAIGLQFSLY